MLGGGSPSPHGIERLRQFFPSLPLLVYTELAPATAGVLLELGRAGIRRVVVHRFEDAPGSLRLALLAELEHSASQQVIQALSETLRELPGELRQALEAMLHAPGDGPSVTALAERARADPSNLRTVVHQGRSAVTAYRHGADQIALCAPAVTRSRLHRRGRGVEAGIQQDEDTADASAGGIRVDRGGIASLSFH